MIKNCTVWIYASMQGKSNIEDPHRNQVHPTSRIRNFSRSPARHKKNQNGHISMIQLWQLFGVTHWVILNVINLNSHQNYVSMGLVAWPIHPKSGSPGSPDSANYFDFPQSYSLRTRKLPNLLCWILLGRAITLKMCCEEMPYMSNAHVLGFRLSNIAQECR